MKYVINTLNKKSKINKDIYGHFSEHLGRCIYEGLFVGEKSEIPNVKGMRTDVVNALKELNIPVLRWPGGCFADEYHWKDGIGKQEERKTMINTHWGGLTEDNSFGTHEFMELCEQLGTEPYINGNVGSGTVQEMQEWVEYMTSNNVSPMTELRKKNGREKPWKVKYFGVGNETWGCGGNMRPEYAADLHRRYQTYVRNYGDNKIFKIASGANDFNYEWTEVFMKNAKEHMNGLTLHYYTVLGPWDQKGKATEFTKSDWYKTLQKTLRMDELILGHSRIMDKYDPDKKVGLIVDEWGTWFDVEVGTNPGFLFQQNTMRDALVAGINLNIFNKHSDRVCMANIAQTVNVLQSVILTEGEKMVLTPTYHVFEMYKHHQNATLVDSFIETETVGIDEFKVPMVHESCSVNEKGELIITLCNLSLDENVTIDSEIVGNKYSNVKACILTGKMDDHNTFDNVDKVKTEVFEKYTLNEKGLTVDIPACSVVTLILA